MLRSRRAVSLEDVVTLAVIVACAVIVLYFVFYVPSQEPQVLPRLTVSLTSLSGIAGQSVQLNVSIRNEGGEAPEVSVTLDSEAFGEVTSTPINVPSYQTKSVAIPAKVKD